MTEQFTVRGYVATDPESRNLPDGTVVVAFRLASTPRWYDAEARNWRDGHTNWLTVQAFRTLGLNALASVKKGQPVVVVGKLKVRFWEGEHGRNTAVDVDAVSIGHDLALGTACFQRTVSSAPPAEQAGDRLGAVSGEGAAEPGPGAVVGPGEGRTVPRIRTTSPARTRRPSPTTSTPRPARSSTPLPCPDGARGSSPRPREASRPRPRLPRSRPSVGLDGAG
jgi:single-strand DNA-binding protein